MKKTFDAVAFQRAARKRLSREYAEDPEGFRRRLRDKYGHLRKRKEPTHRVRPTRFRGA